MLLSPLDLSHTSILYTAWTDNSYTGSLGQGPYPGILLITGSGANDMNETAGFIRINETTGEKEYPPVPFFQIAQYLSERGFAVLRYDKRGVGENHTILDTNVYQRKLDQYQNMFYKTYSVG